MTHEPSGNAERRRCALVLALLSLAYVALFVPANSTGAADANMLGAFQLDEFAQYRTLWRMTDPAEGLGETLRRFVAYDYYNYGFPFFGTSAALFWPLRWAYTDAGAPGLTTASMLVLRQTSSLLDVASILMLVGLWTGFRSTPRAAGLFVFLAALPAVVGDALWWHPDAWVTFFVVATLSLLVLDRRRLGRCFYAAAVACGLATATKLMGLWFFAAVAAHLWRARGGRPWSAIAGHGAGFAAVMALATLAASPMLFVPGEAERVVAWLSEMNSALGTGWGERSEPGPAAWSSTLRSGFGGWTMLLVLLGLCAATARRDLARRDLAVTLLAFALPYTLYVFFGVAKQAERYLLPTLLPLASCAGSPVWLRPLRDASAPLWARAAGVAVAGLLGFQLALHLERDVQRYRDVLERERTSPSLAFQQRLEREVLADLPPRTPLRVLLDPFVYLPPSPDLEVHMRWRDLELADLRAVAPDLLLMRRRVVERGAAPDAVARSAVPGQMARSRPFYVAAQADALPGYRLLLADGFALAYGRTGSLVASSRR